MKRLVCAAPLVLVLCSACSQNTIDEGERVAESGTGSPTKSATRKATPAPGPTAKPATALVKWVIPPILLAPHRKVNTSQYKKLGYTVIKEIDPVVSELRKSSNRLTSEFADARDSAGDKAILRESLAAIASIVDDIAASGDHVGKLSDAADKAFSTLTAPDDLATSQTIFVQGLADFHTATHNLNIDVKALHTDLATLRHAADSRDQPAAGAGLDQANAHAAGLHDHVADMNSAATALKTAIKSIGIA